MPLLKLSAAAALIFLGLGTWPNRRYGTAIALGLCVTAAVVFHFAAP